MYRYGVSVVRLPKRNEVAELVEKKTNGGFKLNISYGGLSKSKTLMVFRLVLLKWRSSVLSITRIRTQRLRFTELPFSKDVSLGRMTEILQKGA